MPFRKPISTFGGLVHWKDIEQNERFILQKHKTGLWPYKYRIIMRENRMEIANSNNRSTIDSDWCYLEENVIPQIDSKIDVWESLSSSMLWSILKGLGKVVGKVKLKK